LVAPRRRLLSHFFNVSRIIGVNKTPIWFCVNTEMKTSISPVPANLRTIRGDLGQAEFAKFLGIANQATYQRYESGRVPKVDILVQIAKRLGITLDELLAPIEQSRAAIIFAQAVLKDAMPETSSGPKQTSAQPSPAGELINDEAIKFITKALRLDAAPQEEVSKLFQHLVSTANKCPKGLMKYYVLIRYAVMQQLAKQHKLK
jgi:transcriptional regulator with XRE-family HTH domain